MKKSFIVLLTLFLLLSGCSSKNNNTSTPEFFAPVIEELENSREVYLQTIAPPISAWWDSGISGGGCYADNEFVCNINNESYSFAYSDFTSEPDDCSWEVIGVFPDEVNGKTYVLFHHFSVDEETCGHPTLTLLEFLDDDPEQYTITPYESSEEFNWLQICYRIGNNIYIAGADNYFGFIDLDTRTLSYCREEYDFAEALVLEKYAQSPYHMFQFRATLQQDDIIVYSAFISEADDSEPVGVVSVAYENAKPIAYMFVDLTQTDISGNVTIQSVE